MKLTMLLAVAMVALWPTHALAQGYSPPGQITVTPPSPAPGDSVTVSVEGCQPAPGTVDVFIDGVLVGTAEVGSDGSFVADFVVPLEAQGAVPVDVDCDDEVLSTLIDVQVGPLPFQPEDLPRTGSEAATLARVGTGLVGVGMVVLVLAKRREAAETVPAHAAPSSSAGGPA